MLIPVKSEAAPMFDTPSVIFKNVSSSNDDLIYQDFSHVSVL
jgi:hypothetical protein